MTYSAWSTAYVTDTLGQNRCYVSVTEWRRLHDENAGAGRIFARLINDGKVVYCSLGEPIVRIEDDLKTEGTTPIVVPDWVREVLYIEGSGEPVDITWLTNESFPNATRVVLRSHDSVLHHTDVREELERALTSHGVVAEGVTIPIGLQSLDDYTINVDVIHTEPANVVLLEGDEVVFEFEEALDSVPIAQPPAQEPAQPQQQQLPQPQESDSMLPPSLLPTPAITPFPPGQGQRLGGTCRPPLPDGRPWNPWRA